MMRVDELTSESLFESFLSSHVLVKENYKIKDLKYIQQNSVIFTINSFIVESAKYYTYLFVSNKPNDTSIFSVGFQSIVCLR